MTFGTQPPSRPPSLGTAVERLRHRWGWVVAYGAFSAALGVVALVLTESATVASVLLIGTFMMVVGVAEISLGFRARGTGRILAWEAAGVLYLLAGLFAVALPELASAVIMLLLGAGLIATGVVRIALGAQMSGTRTRGGVVLAGVVTALLGLFIVTGWPASSAFVLGIFLGLDLLVYGATWIVLGTRLARHRGR